MSIEWLAGAAQRHCPACGAAGPKAVVLATDHVLPGHPRIDLLRCGCGVAFLGDLTVPDYASGGTLAVDYYVEQGYGFDPLAPLLLRLPQGSVRRCLDVGCAFGLLLDFLRFHFGCDVRGVDPSPLAVAGAAALDLPLVQGTLTADL
ncbi:MAG TPA: class I SAM-dependent methyltransferase, partial [Thermoanaerobaculia bacterium]